MTKYNKGKEDQGIRTTNTFKFENTKSNIRCFDHWEKHISDKPYIPTKRLPTKPARVTLNIEFIDKQIF